MKHCKHFKDTCEPSVCTSCESSSMKTTVTDTVEWWAMSKDAHCNDCGKLLGCWDTGNWSCDFIMDHGECND